MSSSESEEETVRKGGGEGLFWSRVDGVSESEEEKL